MTEIEKLEAKYSSLIKQFKPVQAAVVRNQILKSFGYEIYSNTSHSNQGYFILKETT